MFVLYIKSKDLMKSLGLFIEFFKDGLIFYKDFNSRDRWVIF